MSFNPAWEAIGEFDRSVPRAIINEINEVLFAPDPHPEALAQTDVCIVLGSRNCGYKAQRAIELFGSNERVLFIACGANLALSGQPESAHISSILRAYGVDEARVIIDEHSTNTQENLLHADRLLAEHGITPSERQIAVVSSGFHRLHVLANLPLTLSHAMYVSATGPTAGRESWHKNPLGRAVVLHELKRPGLAASLARSLEVATH